MSGNRGLRRQLGRLGLLLMVVGSGFFAWAGIVYFWQDPFTAFANKRAQSELAEQFERKTAGFRPRAVARATPPPLKQSAARFRRAAKRGDAVGRLTIPRLGLKVYVVYGTDTETLKRGPGIDPRTSVPGEGQLVYVAGHRTTYGAPFADIDKLERGDRVTLQTPYTTVTYGVTTRRIVDDTYMKALESRGREELALQACWPRFSADKRIIVYAKPLSFVTAGDGVGVPKEGESSSKDAAAAN